MTLLKWGRSLAQAYIDITTNSTANIYRSTITPYKNLRQFKTSAIQQDYIQIVSLNDLLFHFVMQPTNLGEVRAMVWWTWCWNVLFAFSSNLKHTNWQSINPVDNWRTPPSWQIVDSLRNYKIPVVMTCSSTTTCSSSIKSSAMRDFLSEKMDMYSSEANLGFLRLCLRNAIFFSMT